MTATESTATATRQTGVDFGRLVAMVAVICLHIQLDPVAADAGWYVIINQLARFAVPFFFVAMGYFSRIADRRDDALRTALRLLALYVVWSAIYAAVLGWRADADWRALIQGGRADPLWFLFSAALSLAFVWATHRILGSRGALIVGLGLYAVGLATGTYAPLVFGHDLVWDPRDGLTFGVPFIAIGVWLSRANLHPSPLLAAALFAIAAILQLAEVLALGLFDVFPLHHDFGAATLLLGPAAFLFFQGLNRRDWVARPAQFGGLAFGIYVIHHALVRIAEAIAKPTDALGFWASVAAIFAVSLGLAALLSRLPLLRLAVATRGGPISSRRAPGTVVASRPQ